jgi:acyl carrier protein
VNTLQIYKERAIMIENELILDVVYKAIDSINQQLPKEERIIKSEKSELSQLDSLSVVNLIVELEQNIEDTLGTAFILSDLAEVYSEDGSAMETVQTMVDFIRKSLRNQQEQV